MRRKKINVAIPVATTDAELTTRASANIGLPKFHTLASHTCVPAPPSLLESGSKARSLKGSTAPDTSDQRRRRALTKAPNAMEAPTMPSAAAWN